MGASKKLWEEIYGDDSPNWINQHYDLYTHQQQEKLQEINAMEIANPNSIEIT